MAKDKYINLAQVFDVNGEFVPTKASVYLLPYGLREDVAFDMLSSDIVFDSLNFSSLTQSANKLVPDSSIADYSGPAFLKVKQINATKQYSLVTYPIKGASGNFVLWLRAANATTDFQANIYLDNSLIGSINQSIVGWEWVSVSFSLTDNLEKQLGIRMSSENSALDQVLITSDASYTPTVAEAFSDSPYITIHSMLYNTNASNEPTTALYIYDYKTTLNVKNDGWYNFDLSFIDSSLAEAFSAAKYALVLFASGSDESQYVVWDTKTLSVPSSNPSAIKG